MKKTLRLTMLVIVLAVFGAMTVQAASKVQVCHLPPGNPDNFHSITVPETRLSAHLAHGDLTGSCSASCDALCDDGDACTEDHNSDCEENGCLAIPEPVNCDDSLLCTTDSCDPEAGCQYAPIVCDDADLCTIDACNPTDGQCIAVQRVCGAQGICVPATGDCNFACNGITCDPIDQCHEAGECFLPGVCLQGAAVADGTACDDGDAGTAGEQCDQGVCSGGVDVCPCDFSTENLDCVFGGASPICLDGIASGEYLVLFGSEPSDNCGGFQLTNPGAFVEYVSIWNSFLGEASPETWPVCAANDFFGGGPGFQTSISVEQADICVADLLAWADSHGGVCN